MALYVITYDVRVWNREDYQPLYDQLARWGAAHLQNSVWVAELKGPASAIRDILRDLVHADDTLCVIEIFGGKEWATQKARPEGTSWLKKRSP